MRNVQWHVDQPIIPIGSGVSQDGQPTLHWPSRQVLGNQCEMLTNHSYAFENKHLLYHLYYCANILQLVSPHFFAQFKMLFSYRCQIQSQ